MYEWMKWLELRLTDMIGETLISTFAILVTAAIVFVFIFIVLIAWEQYAIWEEYGNNKKKFVTSIVCLAIHSVVSFFILMFVLHIVF
jgi:hypothetical protein